MLEKAEQREAMLAAILRTAVDPIIMINERGIIESANSATEDVFGYSLEELIGQNIKILMPSPYRENHDRYLINYLTSGKATVIGIGREIVGIRKNGSIFPMELAVSEARVGERIFFTGVIRDITARKKSEQALARLNDELEQRVKDRTRELESAQELLLLKEKMAMLGQVSGGIAHEMKNPLNAIKTSAYYLLNAKDLPVEKIQEHLERIDRQVNLADNVINALSKFAKLPEPKFQAVSVRSCFSESLSTIALPGDIDVEIIIPSHTPHVLVDNNQIMIVFRNLIRNARDAMPDGGKLRLSVEEDGRYLSIAVEDTGQGIPAAILERVMDPLFSTKPRGMGLGLAISRAIVEKHQGEIAISSDVGAGTNIVIKLKSSKNDPA